MAPADFRLFGVYQPADVDLKAGFRWHSFSVGEPAINDPATARTVTVQAAVCRTSRDDATKTSYGARSFFKNADKVWTMQSCEREGCPRLGVLVCRDQKLCQFCHKKKFEEIGSFGPWLALTAASEECLSLVACCYCLATGVQAV
jgi:hypothetical protein